MSEFVHQRKLEYFPLSLYKLKPEDFTDHSYELRNHVGKVNNIKVRAGDDLNLPGNCLLNHGRDNPPLLMYCITMYNESYIQLMQSLAGVFRSYYELVDIDERYKDRCHVVVIADGYEKLTEDFLTK
jgi:hypothetical protein